jgi:hypothetical protein
MDDLASQLERRLGQLVAQRQPSEEVWRDVFTYLAPERATSWYTDETTNASSAQAQRARLYDSTAIDAAEVLKSNFSSGLTPENSRWFGLTAGKRGEEASRWMDGAAQFLFEHIHSSGFSSAAYEGYSDLLPAGWFVMYIEQAKDSQGRDAPGFNFEAWPLKQCYAASSKAQGKVDTIYRTWEPTVEQMVTEYGHDKVSKTTRKMYDEGKLTEKVSMLWAIEPRRGATGMLAKNLPFRSCHMERNSKTIVRESGYHEFPCAVPRWRLIPGTPYATGIGSNVLPDVKTLNDILRLELSSLDIAVSGMWKAVDDGVLNPKTIRIGARKVVMMASLDSMAPLETGADFQVSFSKSDSLRQSIRKTLMADQLTPANGPVRSATEINQNMMLVRQLLGPILGRLQAEFPKVVVERCFGIAFRAGALEAELGPVPESLREADYTVTYISPLSRSQKMEQVTAAQAYTTNLLIQAKERQDPTVLDVVKWDEMNYEIGQDFGVPDKFLRGPEELVKKRTMDAQAKAQAKQAQMQEQLLMQAGGAAIEGAVAAGAA